MMGRLRANFPQLAIVIATAILYGSFELLIWYEAWKRGVGIPVEAHRPTYFMLKVGTILYAASRVISAHPFYRLDYGKWLEGTPWTHRLPLPLGEPRFTWQDAAVLGLVVLLSRFQPHVDPLRIAGLALLYASGFLALPFFSLGLAGFDYAVALLAGLAVRLYPDPREFLMASAVTYGTAIIGLRVSLARFPWSVARLKEARLKDGDMDRRQYLRGPSCGWPFDALRPPPPKQVPLGLHDAVLLSMLAGWWVFAWQSLFTSPTDGTGMSAIVFIATTFGCVGGRFVYYRVGYAPPISVWGRIATGRWIIPGYDQIYLGPACALVAAAGGYKVLLALGCPLEVVFPTCISLVLLVTLTAPPGVMRWRLTGQHRLVCSLFGYQQDKNQYVKVG